MVGGLINFGWLNLFRCKGEPREEKIKSLSGRFLSAINANHTTRAVFNSNNEKTSQNGFLCGVGKVARFAVRFLAGIIAVGVGGIGAVWHLGGMLVHSGKRGKHLESFLMDLFRVCTGGIVTIPRFAFKPDDFFAKGDRRNDGTVPRPKEVKAAEFGASSQERLEKVLKN